MQAALEQGWWAGHGWFRDGLWAAWGRIKVVLGGGTGIVHGWEAMDLGGTACVSSYSPFLS